MFYDNEHPNIEMSKLDLGELGLDEQTTRRYLQKVIRCLHRVDRPIFLGPISMEIGASLDCTEKLLNLLIRNNIVRESTTIEKASIGALSSGSVYNLVGKAKVGLAHI